jgi:hypothetical protein
MRHPAFVLVGALQTLQGCAQMDAAQRLDLRTKFCDVLQQCVTGAASAYDLHADRSCPCLYTQVQDVAAAVPGRCAAERELQRELQELGSMLLTSALTGCLARPLPGDSHSEEWLQQSLRAEIERLTCP